MSVAASSEASTAGRSDSVRVSVRVRPLNAREKAAIADAKTSWSITSSSITQLIGDRPIAANSFAFDHVFEPHINNEQVYSAIAEPVVASAAQGMNGVIFAYGQTAAGKTYTMLGTPEDPGVTRRSISAVFDIISKTRNRQFLLRASYIEIYNEIIRDLLVPDNDNLKIHEDVLSKRVFVDSREEVVTSVQQVMDIIAKGETARAVGETNMNDRSSRSHTIFSLKIESREMSAAEVDGNDSAPADEGVAVRASTLSLVDLAGSERASFTKAQGMRLVEGGHINKSLLTLGTVINKLSSGEQGSSAHIPYRDSKLTRLLQPALGGNARTAIVCAITPAILHMEETLSTLKFASRAKKVTNNAKTNEFLDDRAKLVRAEKEIAFLKKECRRLKAGHLPTDLPQNAPQPLTGLAHESSKRRISAFEKKFEVLLKHFRHDDAIRNATGTARKRKHSEIIDTSISEALDLSFAAGSQGENLQQADASSEALIADLRKKLLDIEKQMRQEQSAISFERQAMVSEVDALLISTEQSDRARQVAEQECSEARFKLGRAQVASLVDEIVSEAISISVVSKDLRKAQVCLSKLQSVDCDNKKLRESLASVEKDHAELLKREKRGVGPVLKEVKFLQGKLAEAEKKIKSFRDRSAKAAVEKAGVERELKNLERQNRALTSEVEKHRGHQAKGQNRLNKQWTEEKQKLESAVKELTDEIAALSIKLHARDEEVTSLNEKTKELEQERAKLKTQNDDWQRRYDVCLEEKDQLDTQYLSSEKVCGELKQKVERMIAAEAAQSDELSALTDELGKAQLELEEKMVELKKVSQVAHNSETEKVALHRAQAETKQKLVEAVKAKEELEGLLSRESSDKEVAFCELANTGKKISELQNTITALEDEVTAHQKRKEEVESELMHERSKLEELRARNSELDRMVKDLNGAKNLECSRLQDELDALRHNLRSECATKESLHEEGEYAKQELRELQEQNEKLASETAVRTRELVKLSEALQLRDRQFYSLQDKLDELGRGEGAIATLERRVRRRDVVIKDMTRRLDIQSQLLNKSLDAEVFSRTDRMAQMEANYAAVLEERQQHENLVSRYEKERTAMLEENRKLREKMKEKDLRMVRDAAKRKEQRHEEIKRKNQALQDIPVNTAST